MGTIALRIRVKLSQLQLHSEKSQCIHARKYALSGRPLFVCVRHCIRLILRFVCIGRRDDNHYILPLLPCTGYKRPMNEFVVVESDVYLLKTIHLGTNTANM
jgi:hypothetical protein